MPLSDDLRNELAAIAPRRECDRLAELSALFHTAGALRIHGRGRVSVVLDVANSAVARRAFTLLRSFGVATDIRTYRRRAFDRGVRYQLHVDGSGRGVQVLNEAGIVTTGLAPLSAPPRRVVARSCCRRAYLRGALIGAGSLSGPRSPHLEIRVSSREGAEFAADVAAAEGLRLDVRERDQHAIAYAKGTAAIRDLLLAAGANDLVLVLEERAVVAATRSRANRLANADHANLVRTSRAAQAQLRAVERLTNLGRLDTLTAPLVEMAELRRENPSMTTKELAAKSNPPVTKATAHRRLQKLIKLAEY
jgi:cell division protein WhiA